MTSWLGGRLIWTCFELRLQQNLHESTISQQRTSRNNSMNFAPQRPLLAKVVHVIGIPPRLYIVHSLQALCTTCGNSLLRSWTCTALKSSQEHHEYGIINSHQRPITACRVLVRMDFGRLCVLCMCCAYCMDVPVGDRVLWGYSAPCGLCIVFSIDCTCFLKRTTAIPVPITAKLNLASI